MNKSLNYAIQYAAQVSPTLDKPTRFFEWADNTAGLLTYIYDADFDTVLTDLVDACKVVQNYEDY